MIINMTGGAGGGGLNFKVVQYKSTPTGTAKENTIGVVTTTDITGWVMQAEEPTGADGLVWIGVAAESDVAFYADKKGFVKLYPKAVKQYVNGKFANVDAYIYQNGWKLFSNAYFYLINGADPCESVTGGWKSTGWKWGGSGTSVAPSFSFTENGMKISPPKGTYAGGILHPTNAIDLSGKKEIKYIISEKDGFTTSDAKERSLIGVFDMSKANASATGGVIASKTIDSSAIGEICSIPIDSIGDGDYVVGCYIYAENQSRTFYWTVKDLWLE